MSHISHIQQVGEVPKVCTGCQYMTQIKVFILNCWKFSLEVDERSTTL